MSVIALKTKEIVVKIVQIADANPYLLYKQTPDKSGVCYFFNKKNTTNGTSQRAMDRNSIAAHLKNCHEQISPSQQIGEYQRRYNCCVTFNNIFRRVNS